MRGTFAAGLWRPDPALYAPRKWRKPCRYEAFVPAPIAGLTPQISGDVAGAISEAESAIGLLNREASPFLAPLARLLLRTESIASSKVEGLQLDARSLARAEANLDTGARAGPTAIEILASIDAMQLAIERSSVEGALDVDDLRDIHRALLGRTERGGPGVLRNVQNWIGGNDYNPCGADFVPPPPERVEDLLIDLCDFSNDSGLPPLMQAAIAHAQFETVHPFEDGNGRTGRALVQIILRRRGLAPAYVPPISVMLARNKQRYIEGLTFFREDRINEWIEIFSEAAAAAAVSARRYLSLVGALQDQWRNQLRVLQPRGDAAAWTIIDALPTHPVITVAIAMSETKRTRPAVANALEQLEECGVLEPLKKTYNRAWEAVGLLDLITQMESGN